MSIHARFIARAIADSPKQSLGFGLLHFAFHGNFLYAFTIAF